MKHIFRLRSIGPLLAIAATAAMMVAVPPAGAQPAPLQDKPFAEHRIALQLSDNDPKKQGLVIRVDYN